MSPVEITEYVSTLLSTALPPKLADAGLDDFTEYINKSPLRSDDSELCVYSDYDNTSAM